MCPLECYHNEINARISFSQLDTNNGIYIYQEKIKNTPNLASDFISRPLNLETTKNSIAFVNIYYETLSYTGILSFIFNWIVLLLKVKLTKY